MKSAHAMGFQEQSGSVTWPFDKTRWNPSIRWRDVKASCLLAEEECKASGFYRDEDWFLKPQKEDQHG